MKDTTMSSKQNSEVGAFTVEYDETNPLDYITKLINVYLYWSEDVFPNKHAHIYVEAIFKLAHHKVKKGEATAEQIQFLVDTLIEAKRYPYFDDPV